MHENFFIFLFNFDDSPETHGAIPYGLLKYYKFIFFTNWNKTNWIYNINIISWIIYKIIKQNECEWLVYI